jgi:hypothetical protein
MFLYDSLVFPDVQSEHALRPLENLKILYQKDAFVL